MLRLGVGNPCWIKVDWQQPGGLTGVARGAYSPIGASDRPALTGGLPWHKAKQAHLREISAPVGAGSAGRKFQAPGCLSIFFTSLTCLLSAAIFCRAYSSSITFRP